MWTETNHVFGLRVQLGYPGFVPDDLLFGSRISGLGSSRTRYILSRCGFVGYLQIGEIISTQMDVVASPLASADAGCSDASPSPAWATSGAQRPAMSGCFGHGATPCDLRLTAPALRRGTSPWPLALDGRCIDLHRRTLRPSVARARPCAGGAAWRGAARRERAAPDGGREGAAGGGGEEAAGREGAAGEEPGRERRGGVGEAAPGVRWSRRRHGVGEELGRQPASQGEQGPTGGARRGAVRGGGRR